MDSEPKNYEIAYLMPSSTLEEEILTKSGKIATLIGELHGVIKRAETPKKRQLAYPINKNKIAYFGWTTFIMSPDSIKMIDKKLKRDMDFLRYLIVEEEIEKLTPVFRPIPALSRAPLKKPATLPSDKPEEKFDLEALDKKLEEILGK